MSGPTLRFENVGVTIGGQQILHDVNFSVAAGTVHCIVGPNGGGKTTLVRSILGQMAHTGRIAIEQKGNAAIGYAPQFLEIDRTVPITVLDLLAIMNQGRPAFWGRARRNEPAHAEVLARVGLTEKRDRLFGQLSGGERQRLLLAQALVPMPGLLIMDEPTSNMDSEGVGIVSRLVRELAAKGVTILWVNHDWAQVRELSDAMTFINRTVVYTGPASGMALGDVVAA